MAGRVAVTGASGFIGRAVVARLRTHGWHVRALLRRSGSEPGRDGIEPVPGSLEDRASLERLVDGADAVVHCAGAVTAPRRAVFAAVNAGGTARLVDVLCASAGAPRLVLISSLAARAPQLSDYAASKRQAEEAVRGSDLAAPWWILRPPAVYGPGDRMTLPWFRQLAQGWALVPAGAGRRFSLLHVSDLADAVQHLLSHGVGAGAGATIELDDGTPGGYSWPDVASIAGRVLDRPVRRVPLPRPLLWPPAAMNRLRATLTGRAAPLTPGKLRELFHDDWVCRPGGHGALDGWTPGIRLEQGFALTLAWYREAGWL